MTLTLMLWWLMRRQARQLRRAYYFLLKALLRTVFAASMGCPNKLTGEILPEYPKEGEEWPLKTDSDEKAMRFCWDQPYSFASNWKNWRVFCPGRHIRRRPAQSGYMEVQ
ncbi:hypothetical protein GALMADRAFT_256395 [Galerina marginata CBS 339.88]|uniref:Uncharacterized protein n=1 Tax=Galerina marginata (strain CBS 339.88) TaxID=685588 RepID=A0A067SDD2_GALM3|nr:hypothetical protein GALMADRAFT_256395 [Galerina marginata CBS 339.88]